MKVLFLDDEPLVLQGIARSLAFAPEHWMLEFCTTGQQALESMRATSYDIVFSDLRMPDMSGAEVLEAFMRDSPNTLRVILSGYSDDQLTIATLEVAQQFLVKPYSGDALIALIQAQESYLQEQHDPEVTRLIGSLRRLPPAPSAVHMMRQLGADNDDLEAIVDIAGRDPSMTAMVMRMANSAYFRPADPICDLHTAALRLGTQTLKTLLLAAGIFRKDVFTASTELDAFSRRAIQAVGIAKVLCAAECDQAMLTATLLADVGRIVLHCNGHQQWAPSDQPDADCHAAIGAYLLQCWGLPSDIVSLVRHHHQPQRAPADLDLNALLRVHLAVSLSNAEDLDHDFIHNSAEGNSLLELALAQPAAVETSDV
nr:HDOD domain-containing protein [Oceanococcus sp. HetDA_MAG_MS8]